MKLTAPRPAGSGPGDVALADVEAHIIHVGEHRQNVCGAAADVENAFAGHRLNELALEPPPISRTAHDPLGKVIGPTVSQKRAHAARVFSHCRSSPLSCDDDPAAANRPADTAPGQRNLRG